jgi:signal transduction histidine kinase
MATAAQHGPVSRRLSLRLKLTLYLAAVALVTQTVLGVVVLYIQVAAIDGLFSARAAARADALVRNLHERGARVDDDLLRQLVHESPRPEFGDRAEAVLYSADGRVLAASIRPAPMLSAVAAGHTGDAPFHADLPGLLTNQGESSPSRVAIRRVPGPDGQSAILAFIGADWSFIAVAGVVRRVLVVGVVVGMVAWIVAAWLIAGLAMAPIRELRAVAESFSPESIEKDVKFASAPSAELAALEQDLHESRARLRSALHAQDRFISNVSHELNTPIAVLLTEAQTLRCDDLPPAAKAFAQSVTEEMQRLGRMVGSFLVLTRIRGGQKLAVLKPCTVNDLIMDAVQTCASIAQQRRISLTPHLTMDDPPLSVCGDVSLLQVMMDNLVRNAIRHSPAGRPVVVCAQKDGADCTIAIQDSGPAVPESQFASIFDRFSEAPRTNGERALGLGLSVAQGIAELHGGRIQAKNLPSGGCEFEVRLPIVASPSVAQPDPCLA